MCRKGSRAGRRGRYRRQRPRGGCMPHVHLRISTDTTLSASAKARKGDPSRIFISPPCRTATMPRRKGLSKSTESALRKRRRAGLGHEGQGRRPGLLHRRIHPDRRRPGLPDEGYLKEVYRLVREAGGVCIADEVQVGFDRVGSHWWALETQGVVPDSVTMGKPIGDGHPLAAVVTTRNVTDSSTTVWNISTPSVATRAPASSNAYWKPVSAIRRQRPQRTHRRRGRRDGFPGRAVPDAIADPSQRHRPAPRWPR